ncbi:MAG: CHAT domain-containing protein [Chitinophagales bacterium]
MWNRLVFLRDSSVYLKTSQAEILKELVEKESQLGSCVELNDSTPGFLLQRIAVAYFNVHKYREAENYARNSVKFFKKPSSLSYTQASIQIRAYNLLNMLYDSLGKVRERINAIDSLLAVSFKYNIVDPFVSYALAERIPYLIEFGDYQKSYEFAEMGRRMTRQIYAGNPIDSFSRDLNFLIWKFEALVYLRKFDEAKNLFPKKIEDYAKKHLSGDLGNIYYRMAISMMNNRKFIESLEYFTKSVLADQKLGNYLDCALTLSNQGFFFYHLTLKDEPKAIACYQEAVRFANRALLRASGADSINIRAETLNILSNIGTAYAEMDNYDSAFHYFKRARDQVKKGINENDLFIFSTNDLLTGQAMVYASYMLIYEADAFLGKYRVKKEIAILNEAIRLYHIADRIFIKIKMEQSDINSKLFWRSDFHKLYEHAIEAAYLQNNASEVFYFIEKSKAVLLNDQVNQVNKISNVEISEVAKLKKSLLQLDRVLENRDLPAKSRADLEDQRIKNKQDLERLDQLIKDQNPIYYQSYLDTASTRIEEVSKKLLKADQALLELFEGDSIVYAMLITRNNEWIHKIDKIDYDSTASKYYFFISNPSLRIDQFGEFMQTASHLYRIIFHEETPPKGRLIISPDGPYFPFEALVTNEDISGPVFFLKDHVVSYTYSARYLLNEFGKNQKETQSNFLGIAPVNYPGSSSLTSLPESDRSLTIIRDYFGEAQNLVGQEASRSHFLDGYSTHNIVQLYTHASDSSDHGEPVIQFADSALYLSELIPENKPLTQLIVLSACETGLGKLYRGEGVFSFNRAFASIGIPSSIINLWKVDNQATYQLTELFYKYLAKGMETDLALQQAKLDFLQHASKEKSLPYYWAAAILAGKSTKLMSEKKSNWIWPAVGIALALLGMFGWQYWQRQKNNFEGSR